MGKKYLDIYKCCKSPCNDKDRQALFYMEFVLLFTCEKLRIRPICNSNVWQESSSTLGSIRLSIFNFSSPAHNISVLGEISNPVLLIVSDSALVYTLKNHTIACLWGKQKISPTDGTCGVERNGTSNLGHLSCSILAVTNSYARFYLTVILHVVIQQRNIYYSINVLERIFSGGWGTAAPVEKHTYRLF